MKKLMVLGTVMVVAGVLSMTATTMAKCGSCAKGKGLSFDNASFYDKDGKFDEEKGKDAIIALMKYHGYPVYPNMRENLWVSDYGTGEFGMQVVLAGGPSELELRIASEIEAAMKSACINLVGKDTLEQSKAMLARADLVISPDSGPAHIASALGVPLVMLFSWSNPARIYPYGRPDCMAAIDPFSRNPRVIKSKDPKHNVRHVTLDMVWEKVEKQFSVFSV